MKKAVLRPDLMRKFIVAMLAASGLLMLVGSHIIIWFFLFNILFFVGCVFFLLARSKTKIISPAVTDATTPPRNPPLLWYCKISAFCLASLVVYLGFIPLINHWIPVYPLTDASMAASAWHYYWLSAGFPWPIVATLLACLIISHNKDPNQPLFFSQLLPLTPTPKPTDSIGVFSSGYVRGSLVLTLPFLLGLLILVLLRLLWGVVPPTTLQLSTFVTLMAFFLVMRQKNINSLIQKLGSRLKWPWALPLCFCLLAAIVFRFILYFVQPLFQKLTPIHSFAAHLLQLHSSLDVWLVFSGFWWLFMVPIAGLYLFYISKNLTLRPMIAALLIIPSAIYTLVYFLLTIVAPKVSMQAMDLLQQPQLMSLLVVALIYLIYEIFKHIPSVTLRHGYCPAQPQYRQLTSLLQRWKLPIVSFIFLYLIGGFAFVEYIYIFLGSGLFVLYLSWLAWLLQLRVKNKIQE